MKYTELETRVINAFDGADTWCNLPCLTFAEIANETDIESNKLRGVVSSLDQKGAIFLDELPTCEAFTLRI